MSEKVSGFYTKNADKYTCYDGYVRTQFSIDEDKLVPVVSIKWLEKECEKQDKWAIAGSALRELFLAALKQAKVKRYSEAKKK